MSVQGDETRGSGNQQACWFPLRAREGSDSVIGRPPEIDVDNRRLIDRISLIAFLKLSDTFRHGTRLKASPRRETPLANSQAHPYGPHRPTPH